VGPRSARSSSAQIARDALFQLLHALLELGLGEVLVAVVDRLELAAVDGDRGLLEQAETTAQQDELAAGGADRITVVLAEVGDGLEVGRQEAQEPHEFHIAVGFLFELAAGADAVEVAVDVEAEEVSRIVRWPSQIAGDGMGEA
jgi:hypothetical protein